MAGDDVLPTVTGELFFLRGHLPQNTHTDTVNGPRLLMPLSWVSLTL